MSITAIDAQTALIVIDLQQGLVTLDTCHPIKDIIDNSCKLVSLFRYASLPIVLVNVDGIAPGRTEQVRVQQQKPENWSLLIDELQPQQDDLQLTKNTWGAFASTELHKYLASLKVSQVVISGIATSMGVESTARQAFELGYNVTIATDAITDFNMDIHNNSVHSIFPKLAETGTTADIVDRISTDHA
ncbi:cysteine hydrolase family protein [Shewanella sp. UCD-KL21]|uniref:cysteine hydrolase family protein n=1 Tax=Shewanella sp. UCD-KL21 TaxID=1917164 RepID=UPI000970CDC1|nr:isochorismatase family cysteine hydrolase [Shewanella sp. UCD-KL21]